MKVINQPTPQQDEVIYDANIENDSLEMGNQDIEAVDLKNDQV